MGSAAREKVALRHDQRKITSEIIELIDPGEHNGRLKSAGVKTKTAVTFRK
jgi:hypothetical protein